MTEQMIKCTMCGEEQTQDMFRVQKSTTKKGDQREYRRPFCKDCEAIEVRRQYLLSMPELPPEFQEELDQIKELYRLRAERGLNTFGNRKFRRGVTSKLVADQLTKLKDTKDTADDSAT